MSRQTLHRRKWSHNREFLTTIPDKYSDWMVTVAFYAAVHCFETLSAKDKNSPHASHRERLRTLKNAKRYAQIYKHFRPLYDAASGVRYDADFKDWISAEDAKKVFARHHLHQIEVSVQTLTGDTSKLTPLNWPGDAAVPLPGSEPQE